MSSTQSKERKGAPLEDHSRSAVLATQDPAPSRASVHPTPAVSQAPGHDKGRRSSSRAKSYPHRGIFSAIDLGTNNCRLLIARPTRSGFRVIDAFSRIVRLGEGVAETGLLSEEAMDRTVEALKICAKKVARRRVTCMRHVATEACRVAGNTRAFVERVREEVGINLEVISAAEEARLAVIGCQSLISRSCRHALVFDIGGGSTELIWLKINQGRAVEINGWMSVPWGVVNLTERYGQGSLEFPAGTYEAMKAEVRRHIEPFEAQYQLSEALKMHKVQLLGTSGTVTTLASLQLDLPQYSRDKVDGAWMPSADMLALSQQLAAMSHADRAAKACIGDDRARLVVAGCAILEAMLELWPAPSLRVADRGIREGILRGLMENDMPVSVKVNTANRPAGG